MLTLKQQIKPSEIGVDIKDMRKTKKRDLSFEMMRTKPISSKKKYVTRYQEQQPLNGKAGRLSI